MIKNEPDFLNFLKTPEHWEFTEELNIPVVKGMRLKNENALKFVNFNEAHRTPLSNRKQETVHFFQADYLIERTFTRASQTAEFLSGFKACLSPDFSQYIDMPKAMCIWNHYRKMWVSRFWQDYGIRVIPVAGWSDESSYEYCFEGMPKKSLIAVSTVGIHRDPQARYYFEKGYNEMMKRLEPDKVVVYGKLLDCCENVIHLRHINDEKFKAIKTTKSLEKLELMEENHERITCS